VRSLVLGKTTACSVSIMAVGSGGQGSCSTGGGGGSGFVEMTTVSVENLDEMNVHVGTPSKTKNSDSSRVEIKGIEVIAAKPGEKGESYINSTDISRSTDCSGPSAAGVGGNGFSGGGGYGSDHGGYGGSNGGNGSQGSEGYYKYKGPSAKGGEGSGIKLEDFNQPNFRISYGRGGKYNTYINQQTQSNGGGGGGVLVDGKGPKGSDYQGQGYGGGGAGGGFNDRKTPNPRGLPGVVVIVVN